MSVFVSYAAPDQAAVRQLVTDLGVLRRQVWLDQKPAGSREQWDNTLDQIRSCAVFIFALSPNSLRSKICRIQLDYAAALHRPVLPVLLSPLDATPIPPALAGLDIVDYIQRSSNSALALSGALARIRPADPLGTPEPVRPAAPNSNLATCSARLDEPELTFTQQHELFTEFRSRLVDPDDHAMVMRHLYRLRNRRDLAHSLFTELDQVLTGTIGSPPARTRRRIKKQTVVWSVAAAVVVAVAVVVSLVLLVHTNDQTTVARDFVNAINTDDVAGLSSVVCSSNQSMLSGMHNLLRSNKNALTLGKVNALNGGSFTVATHPFEEQEKQYVIPLVKEGGAWKICGYRSEGLDANGFLIEGFDSPHNGPN